MSQNLGLSRIYYIFFFTLFPNKNVLPESCYSPKVDSAIHWINEGILKRQKIALVTLKMGIEEELNLLPDSCKALIWYKRGVAEFRNGNLYLAVQSYKHALEQYQKYTSSHAPEVIRMHMNIGRNYQRLENIQYLDSVEYYLNSAYKLNAEREEKGGKVTSIFPTNLLYLGRYYRDIGDYSRSKKFYEYLVNFCSNKPSQKRILAIAYLDLSSLYSNFIQHPKEGIKYGKLSLETYRKIKTIPQDDTLATYFNLGLAYEVLGSFSSDSTLQEKAFQEALKYYQEAQVLFFKKRETLREGMGLEILNNIGVLLNQQQKFGQALDTLRITEAINRENNDPEKLAKNWDNMGIAHEGLGNLSQALKAYSESLKYQFSGFQQRTIWEPPNLQHNRTYNPINAIETLSNKARVLFSMYSTENEENFLHAAIATYRCLDTLISRVRSELTIEDSKFSLSKRTKPIYAKAIQTCLLLDSIRANPSYKNEAFYFAERSKALSLLESTRGSQAIKLEIPTAYQDTLLALTRKKNYLERVLALLQVEGLEATKISQSLAAYTNVTNRLGNYEKELEKKFSSYVGIKEDLGIISVQTLQKEWLNEGEAIIEYFLESDYRYAFIITKKAFSIKKLSSDTQTLSQVQAFHASIRTYYEDPHNKRELSDLREEFSKVSHSLFKALISPLDSLPNTLIIIPDECLMYLPFEALLISPVREHNNYSTYLYLLREKTIRYAFSGTLLFDANKSQRRERFSDRWSGFAPIFPQEKYKRKQEILPLPQSKVEVERLQGYMGGKVFLLDSASFKNLIHAVVNSKILHVASHAVIEDSDSSLVRLELWDTTLFNLEIQSLNIKSDLVLLNSCETNMGALYKGEGMTSLNRAFTAAGARNIITTFWQIKDNSHWDFWKEFYGNLIAGRSVSKALSIAKRKVALTQDPYFWASYVLYGDSTILFPNYNSEIITSLVILIVLFSLIFWRSRRKVMKIS